jgi:hypothetical protein
MLIVQEMPDPQMLTAWVAENGRRSAMTTGIFGAGLMAVGFALMLSGIAWHAKCREGGAVCCASMPVLVFSCR